MNQYFMTGTDTGVGKTLASAILMYVLKAKYWKPIQSGIKDEISDLLQIKNLTGFSDDFFIPSVYRFQASLSPDQAAALENTEIDLSHFNQTWNHSTIVEGAGGIFVPLNQRHLQVDLMSQLKLPVIIVARGTLGTINHTLLTIEGLRQKNISIQGIVFSGKLNPDNQTAIEKWGQVKTLFHIPFFEKVNKESLKHWIFKNNNKILEALK